MAHPSGFLSAPPSILQATCHNFHTLGWHWPLEQGGLVVHAYWAILDGFVHRLWWGSSDICAKWLKMLNLCLSYLVWACWNCVPGQQAALRGLSGQPWFQKEWNQTFIRLEMPNGLWKLPWWKEPRCRGFWCGQGCCWTPIVPGNIQCITDSYSRQHPRTTSQGYSFRMCCQKWSKLELVPHKDEGWWHMGLLHTLPPQLLWTGDICHGKCQGEGVGHLAHKAERLPQFGEGAAQMHDKCGGVVTRQQVPRHRHSTHLLGCQRHNVRPPSIQTFPQMDCIWPFCPQVATPNCIPCSVCFPFHPSSEVDISTAMTWCISSMQDLPALQKLDQDGSLTNDHLTGFLWMLCRMVITLQHWSEPRKVSNGIADCKHFRQDQKMEFAQSPAEIGMSMLQKWQ